MNKLIIVIAVTFFSAISVTAQKSGATKLSAGPEIGIATGSFNQKLSLGIGISGQVEHFFQDKISGTGLIGIMSYFGKRIPGQNDAKYTSAVIVPIRVGARYYIGDAFHIGLQMGVGIISGLYLYNGTAFSYSPQIGYNFKTNKNRKIDASFKYDAYVQHVTIGAVGVRLAYVF
jgi:hypothetical protein